MSFWRNLRNLFDKSIPDTGFDNGYFDMLSSQPEAKADESETANTADVNVPPETNHYIQTTRGKKVSYADINGRANKRAPQPTPRPDDAPLDLRRKPDDKQLPVHVLDTRS